MAAKSPTRPPWETSQWRTFYEPPPEPSTSKSIGPLGVVAIAFGVGLIGAYMLDLHGHTCEVCGHRWRHLGAFNLGDPVAHTCRKCGTVQWWKDGIQQVFRDPLSSAEMPSDTFASRMQELRDLPRMALPFGTPATSPRGVLR